MAREYATVRPATIRLELRSTTFGKQAWLNRAIAVALPHHRLLEGSGRRFSDVHQRCCGLNREAIKRTDLMQKSLGRPARTINMVELGKALNLMDNPLSRRYLFTTQTRRRFAFKPERSGERPAAPDHEQFFTDTTDYADVLPCWTTFFAEHKELQTSYGHFFLQVSNQAIAPLGGGMQGMWKPSDS